MSRQVGHPGIARLLARRGLTLTQLSQRVGLSTCRVSKLLSGQAPMPAERGKQIAGELGTNAHTLNRVIGQKQAAA